MNNPYKVFKDWADAIFDEANIGDTVVFNWTGDFPKWRKDSNTVTSFELTNWLDKDLQKYFFDLWVEKDVLTAVGMFIPGSESQWNFEFKITN